MRSFAFIFFKNTLGHCFPSSDCVEILETFLAVPHGRHRGYPPILTVGLRSSIARRLGRIVQSPMRNMRARHPWSIVRSLPLRSGEPGAVGILFISFCAFLPRPPCTIPVCQHGPMSMWCLALCFGPFLTAFLPRRCASVARQNTLLFLFTTEAQMRVGCKVLPLARLLCWRCVAPRLLSCLSFRNLILLS